MGALYRLKLKHRSKSDAIGIAGKHQFRTSAEISAAALSAYYPQMSAEADAAIFAEEERQLSQLLQNWRWYIREHWKQALVATVCYLLTFLVWRKLS
jgi:hypothetical protein